MKKLLITAGLIAAMVTAYSQTLQKVADKGNWVIENNIHSPRIQTIKFYDEAQNLVYEETIHKKLRVSRARVRSRLNNVLAQIINSGNLPSKRGGILIVMKN